MDYDEKRKSTGAGDFLFRRYVERQEFVCDRDMLPRKAKIVVRWTTPQGVERTICNSCYGFLMSGA
ncbi:MAG: hypothetical protein JWL97_3647 [Gemmatimonadales bacterium]|jgi:RNase P subunit RPR2|nr:hypothetical protein [Gemmatimonadales bacterium]